MKRPKNRGVAINPKRYSSWLAAFRNYRIPVNQELVQHWLAQFDDAHRDTAARVLDSVLFLDQAHIEACFRTMLSSLQGWHRFKTRRQGRWYFVPFSRSAGESGDSMTHAFRRANGLSARYFDELFIQRSEIPLLKLGPEDHVVLIDDFSGTGDQACKSWAYPFEELLASGPKVYLMIVAATRQAQKQIREKTEMELVCVHILKPSAHLFSADCEYFEPAEKTAILDYCQKVDAANAKGYGGCGLTVILGHQAPNNSIPILTTTSDDWDALFPRS
jgi:hypothetical protein